MPFGPERETIGTLLLDLSGVLDLSPAAVESIRGLQASRMGLYEVLRAEEEKDWRLRELVTEKDILAVCPTGYPGQPGQLWYVRVCPPLDVSGEPRGDRHLVFMTPYVILRTGKADWMAYFERSLAFAGPGDPTEKLHELMKFGAKPRHWCEYVCLAYVNHVQEAVLLTGIPDIEESLPHAGLWRP